MKKLLHLFFVLVALLGCSSAQVSYFSDHAIGVSPFGHIVGLIPIQYGQVRVCTWPGASGTPCTPLANITNQYGTPLTVQGGNFGQITTDVTGLFSFGCTAGSYLIQVAASSSNTPSETYTATCPVTSASNTFVPEVNLVIASSGDYGIAANAAITQFCGAGCKLQIPSGTFNSATTVNYQSGVDISCMSPQATILTWTGGTGYMFSALNAKYTTLENCEFMVGNGGVMTTTGQEYHYWKNLLSYGGNVGQPLYRITGTRTNNTNIDYFQNVQMRNFLDAGIWIDNALDVFLSNDDSYGVVDNTTSQALVIDSGVSGINLVNFLSGDSGMHALAIQNVFNNTAVTGSVSAGSSVSIPVTNSGVCLVSQPVEVWDGTNSDRPTITSIPDGTHVVVSTLANGYTNTATVSCGFAPNDFQSFRMVADDCAGGDCIYMNSTINHGAGSTGFSYLFDGVWAAGAGNTSENTCATPASYGFHIRGGQTIIIQGGEIRSNCGGGILVDRVGVSNIDLIVKGNEITDNGMSGDNTYDGIQVTQPQVGLVISGNRSGSLNLGVIRPRYGINISASGSTNVVITDNDLHGNRTDALADNTSAGNFTHAGNVNNSQNDLLEIWANPFGRTYIEDTNYYLDINAGNPIIQFETSGNIFYNRTTHAMSFNLPGLANALNVNSTGITSGGNVVSTTGVTAGTLVTSPTVNATTAYQANGTAGFSGTIIIGSNCNLVVSEGIITAHTGVGCP